MATINGTANDDILTGTTASDLIDGKAGGDKMTGGAGDDTYIVDSGRDRTYEQAGGGYDTVQASVSHTLLANVERLILTGSASTNGAGNDLNNKLTGNAGNNVLDGRAGADIMYGGLGDDTYIVDNIGDRTIEGAGGGGIDTVQSSVNFTLADNMENLRLTGSSGLSGTGNALNNKVTGNGGNNLLDGGAGADIMYGGLGNDTYIVDNAGDRTVEGAGGGGIDTVKSSVSLTLATNMENLTLTGNGAISGAGNELANTIVGNGGNNVLNGGQGADTLTGGAGADIFAFTAPLTSVADTITDFSAADDTIRLGGGNGQPFSSLGSGALGAGSFVTGSAALDADDYLIYDSADGKLYFDADGAGGNAAVHFNTLETGLALTASDFQVAGASNQLAAISSGATASVAENSAASTVVYQASATDPDGDRIVFTIGGADAAKFTIDAVTGEVRLKNPADYETKSSYSFTVTAADSSGLGGSKDVTLSVTNVAEGGSAYTVAEKESNNTSGTAQALNRDLFTVVDNPNVQDDSLPTAIVTGSVATGTDKDFFSITLKEGELLILDVDGTTNGLDALVRVFGPGGTELIQNDDPGFLDPGSKLHSYGHNTDSLVSFRAPTAGTYTFSVASFVDDQGGSTSGNYTLNVSVGPPASMAQIHNENIDALISGSKWGTSTVSFGFTTSASQYGSGQGMEEKNDGFETLNSTQRAVVRTGLNLVQSYTNLALTENSTSPGSAQMRYAMSDNPDTAHAYYPGTGDGGDSWYNNNGPTWDGTDYPPQYDAPKAGNYAYATFLHESGHALGLKHGHETPPLNFAQDSMEYSIMTYRSYVGASTGDDGGYTNETWGYAQTFMMYDIAALQRMYGADFVTNSGATIYSWSPTTGAFMINGAIQWTPGGNRVFMTLWDGGGTDTYDLSNYSNRVTIDLRPGEWSTTSSTQLANLGQGHSARGNVANALLFNGDTRSLVENAVGGSGGDVLIANDAVNRLTGGQGFDQFHFKTLSASGRGSLADTITDFVSGGDLIDLTMIDANDALAGNQAFTFIGKSAFSGTAGELRFGSAGNNTLRIFADVDGDAISDFELVVHSSVITINDFYF